jgi:hypothetical protein
LLSHRPGSGQQNVADEIAVDGDAVGDPRHLGNGRMLGHHGRMHPLLDTAVGEQRDAEQFDAVAKIVGGLDVRLADALDAFHVNLIERDLGAEGEAR